VRPHDGQGVVVGGRLNPPEDGKRITLIVDGRLRRTVTSRGGWFMFTGVPRDAVGQIAYKRASTVFHPWRGRVFQAARNDLEYHIYAAQKAGP